MPTINTTQSLLLKISISNTLPTFVKILRYISTNDTQHTTQLLFQVVTQQITVYCLLVVTIQKLGCSYIFMFVPEKLNFAGKTNCLFMHNMALQCVSNFFMFLFQTTGQAIHQICKTALFNITFSTQLLHLRSVFGVTQRRKTFTRAIFCTTSHKQVSYIRYEHKRKTSRSKN